MKKLIVVMAAIAIFGPVSAASFNWKCSSDWVTTSDASEGGDYAGYSVYVFNSGVTSLAALTAALDSGTVSALGDSIGSGTITDDAFDISGSAEATDKLGVFAVILDTASAGGHYTTIDFGEVTLTDAHKAGAIVNFYNSELYLGSPASWSTVAAPEPTSGLLLILGMAGLALRRKRA